MSSGKPSYRFMISGGGTGGHINPAIAIADALKDLVPSAQFLFVGAEGKMEMKRVPKAGYSIIGLPIRGIQRTLSLALLAFPFKLIKSLFKAWLIVKKFNPDAVIGVGGYASAPTLYVANLQKRLTYIQEQNSYAGLTNKVLAGKAHKIFVAYDGMDAYFPPHKVIHTGNPLRKDLSLQVDKQQALHFFGLEGNKPVLFCLGGSLGARTLNDAFFAGVKDIVDAGVQLIWQCGKLYENEFKPKVESLNLPGVWIGAYIERMDMAYSAADVVVSRSGALSVSELCLVGKPVIFVPSPNVAEDHQTKNAEAIYKGNGAQIVKDHEAREQLVQTALVLIKNENRKAILSEHIKRFAKPNAATEIAQYILKDVERRAAR